MDNFTPGEKDKLLEAADALVRLRKLEEEKLRPEKEKRERLLEIFTNCGEVYRAKPMTIIGKNGRKHTGTLFLADLNKKYIVMKKGRLFRPDEFIYIFISDIENFIDLRS